MVGSVHPLQTIELLMTLDQMNYKGVIYFDTFPDITNLDPVSECATNITTTERFSQYAKALRGNNALAEAIANQDAVTAHRIVTSTVFGA
jgi:hypothetical protein